MGETLATSVPGVFAAGDVASHAHPVFGRVRVEHFDNAIKMGEHAARAMLGSPAAFDDPHWFWSDQYDHQIQMGGVAATGEMVVRGSIEERSFCAFFLDEGGALRASVSLDWPRDVRRSLASDPEPRCGRIRWRWPTPKRICGRSCGRCRSRERRCYPEPSDAARS